MGLAGQGSTFGEPKHIPYPRPGHRACEYFHNIAKLFFFASQSMH